MSAITSPSLRMQADSIKKLDALAQNLTISEFVLSELDMMHGATVDAQIEAAIQLKLKARERLTATENLYDTENQYRHVLAKEVEQLTELQQFMSENFGLIRSVASLRFQTSSSYDRTVEQLSEKERHRLEILTRGYFDSAYRQEMNQVKLDPDGNQEACMKKYASKTLAAENDLWTFSTHQFLADYHRVSILVDGKSLDPNPLQAKEQMNALISRLQEQGFSRVEIATILLECTQAIASRIVEKAGKDHPGYIVNNNDTNAARLLFTIDTEKKTVQVDFESKRAIQGDSAHEIDFKATCTYFYDQNSFSDIQIQKFDLLLKTPVPKFAAAGEPSPETPALAREKPLHTLKTLVLQAPGFKRNPDFQEELELLPDSMNILEKLSGLLEQHLALKNSPLFRLPAYRADREQNERITEQLKDLWNFAMENGALLQAESLRDPDTFRKEFEALSEEQQAILDLLNLSPNGLYREAREHFVKTGDYLGGFPTDEDFKKHYIRLGSKEALQDFMAAAEREFLANFQRIDYSQDGVALNNPALREELIAANRLVQEKHPDGEAASLRATQKLDEEAKRTMAEFKQHWKQEGLSEEQIAQTLLECTQAAIGRLSNYCASYTLIPQVTEERNRIKINLDSNGKVKFTFKTDRALDPMQEEFPEVRFSAWYTYDRKTGIFTTPVIEFEQVMGRRNLLQKSPER